MRADMKALLKIIGTSCLLAVVVLGILTAAALNVLSREMAIILSLVVLLVGGVAIRRAFAPALFRLDRGHDESAESDTPAGHPGD